MKLVTDFVRVGATPASPATTKQLAMRGRRRRRPYSGFLAATLCFTIQLLLCSTLRAESVFVDSNEIRGVTIQRIDDNNLVWEINGHQTSRDLAAVTRIITPSDPSLSAAEEAFSQSSWDAAVDGYEKAIRTASRGWVKDFAARRMIVAAGKSGRFDSAANGYILAVLKDPTSAAAMKPALPEAGSSYLASALDDVKSALNDSTLTADQRKALLAFQLELQHATGDKLAQEATADAMAKLPGATDDPQFRAATIRRKLDAAQKQLDTKMPADAQKALDALGTIQPLLTDVAAEGDALFLTAQAREILAEGRADDLKDAALAYMRVVALAKTMTGQPHVIASLMKAAALCEKTNDRTDASKLYQQVAAAYPHDPAAETARRQLQLLSAAAK